MTETRNLCGISERYPPSEVKDLIEKRGPDYEQMIEYVTTRLYFCKELRNKIYAYLKVQSNWEDYLDDLWTESVMMLADRLYRGFHDGQREVEPLLWRIFVNRWKTQSKKLGKKQGLEFLKHVSEEETEVYDTSTLESVLSILSSREIGIFKRRALRQKDHEIAEDFGLRTAEVRKIVYRARTKINNALNKN